MQPIHSRSRSTIALAMLLVFLIGCVVVWAANIPGDWTRWWGRVRTGTLELHSPYKIMTYGDAAYPVQIGATACGAEALLLGAGAKSGGEATTATANKNFVDFRTASTATSGWSHAGAWYLKVQGVGGSGSALRGYAYADNASGAQTGEISGVYGIFEQHGAGTVSATGKGAGVRSRVTIPSGLTLTTGNYYGLLIETDIQSSLASCTESAYIKINDPNGRGKWLKDLLIMTNADAGTDNTHTIKTDLGTVNSTHGIHMVYNGTPLWLMATTNGSP